MRRGDPFTDDPADLVRRVYAYVAYRIGSGPDAEDVTSAAFERALRYRESYDARRGPPAAWLIGIAQRCIADAGREGLQTVELVDVEMSGDLADGAVERVDLRRAIAVLPERDRELIGLRYGADLKSKEIARLLEMRPGAVDVALHRALARLREMMESGEPRNSALERGKA